MYFYFYKITNNINKKFYYGVHKTNNLEDGYMGSGVAIRKAYKKYGINNFQKEILMFFQNEKQMFDYQQSIVNEQMIKNVNCYNMIIGGRDQNVIYKLTSIAKKSNINNGYQPQKKGIIAYWNTGDIEAKKKKQSQANKKYWNTGDVQTKRKNRSISQIKLYEKHPEIRKKISETNKAFWASEVGEKTKKQRTENNRKNPKMIRYYLRLKKQQSGYNNFDFKNRWKSIYDKDSDKICDFLIKTDLPQSFIINNIFGKKVKAVNLIKYYQHIGKLPQPIKLETKKRFLKMENEGKGHKDGGTKKSYFSEPQYKIMFIFNDFFQQFNLICNEFLSDMKISDSDVLQGKLSQKYKNFRQVIQYFSEIGIIQNKRVVKIKKLKTVGNRTFLFTTTKTIFDVNWSNQQKTLLDEELNKYEYDNDDGKLVCKGRFKL